MREIGGGSCKEVYLARIIDKFVVVKSSKGRKKQFAKEVRILCGLQFKHIFGVEDYSLSTRAAMILQECEYYFKPLRIDGDRITSLNEYLEFLRDGTVMYQCLPINVISLLHAIALSIQIRHYN